MQMQASHVFGFGLLPLTPGAKKLQKSHELIPIKLQPPKSHATRTAPSTSTSTATSSSSIRVVQVASGNHFSAILTTTGAVYTFGNGGGGRLGHGSSEATLSIAEVKPIAGFGESGVRIVQIAAGNWHCAAVDEQGRLFVWGNGSRGCLGTGNNAAVCSPIHLREGPFENHRVKFVRCGFHTTAAVLESGALVVMGDNGNGKLGMNSSGASSFATPVLHSFFDGSSPERRVVDISMSHNFGLACTESGQVYSWGKNNSGQLGVQSTVSSSTTPLLVNLPSGERFIAVASNKGEHYEHSAALSEQGVIYMWGSNYKGKLGTGDTEDTKIPTPVRFFVTNGIKIRKIDLGGIHSTAISDNNTLYTWGCGSDGRLGHPESREFRYLYREYEPRAVSSIEGSVVDSSASYYNGIVAAIKRHNTQSTAKSQDLRT